jgi:Fur family ferric uptake transcriptional regulator
MTVAQHDPGVSVGSVEEAISFLRARGMRVSVPRRLMLSTLFAAEAPISAEGLAGLLKASGADVDVASIYRNLEAFERTGLVRHFHLGHGPGLYSLVGHDDREYLYCERCHEVLVVSGDRLAAAREAIRAASGYEARFTHFPIVGVCGRCADGVTTFRL